MSLRVHLPDQRQCGGTNAREDEGPDHRQRPAHPYRLERQRRNACRYGRAGKLEPHQAPRIVPPGKLRDRHDLAAEHDGGDQRQEIAAV